MYHVYVLRSLRDGKFYIDLPRDIGRRFLEHQRGYVFSTAPRRPWELLYTESCRSKVDAMRREKYLKTTHGRRFLAKRIKDDLGNK